MNKLNMTLILTNNATYLIAKVVIFLTLLHLLWITSPVHAGIISLCYLTMEILNLQLSSMIKNQLPKSTLPELKLVIEDTIKETDDSNTTH